MNIMNLIAIVCQIKNEKMLNALEPKMNRNASIDEKENTFDPATIVGLHLSIKEKQRLITMGPCQPSQLVLKQRRSLSLSVSVFHDDGTRHKWISYSLSQYCLLCIPCIPFTDATSRGETIRPKQGNAFASTGFSKWKNQYSRVLEHKKCNAHLNAKVAEALFLQNNSLTARFDHQEVETERRKKKVISNRIVMKRAVDVVMFLGLTRSFFQGPS